MSVTIPAAVHAKVVAQMRAEYEAEIGPVDDAVRGYTRDELIATYRQARRFWSARVPTIDTSSPPDMHTIGRHAVATNALHGIDARCRRYGIEREVTQAASA